MFFPTLQQPAPAPALTLEAAASEALQNHRRVAAARKETDAARLGVRSARARTNPEALFSPALDQFNGTTEELLITQPLELNGTRTARTRAALAQVRVSEAALDVESREVATTAKLACVALWKERMVHALAKSLTENARTVHQLAQRQVDLGSRAGIDTAQTGLEVVRARQQETLAQSRVKQAEAALSLALGRPLGESAPEIAPPIAKIETPALDVAVKAALEARAELAGELARKDVLVQESTLVRAEGKPDLAPQFRSQYVTFQRPKRSDYGFSVAVRLPLLDWGGRKGRTQQTELAAAAQDERIAQARREIEGEVQQALTRLDAATTVLASFSEALPEAERLLRASRVGLEEGKTSILSVLEAQRTYRAFLTEHIEAQAELARAQVELTRVLGGTL